MSTPSDLAGAAQATVAALVASANNPPDAIRVLTQLAGYAPVNATAPSPIGQAMGAVQSASNDVFRRAAVVAMARASAQYQPASAEDAKQIRDLVCAALDAEITIAGDQHQDATFNALRSVRAAVAKDLTDRGAGLPQLATVQTALPIPAPVLAQQLYRDSTRADELVTQSNSPHPAFMPTSFKALAQ